MAWASLQLKDEIYRCPPVLVLTGCPQDAWLATWSRAEAAVPHPLDPIRLAETVVALLRTRCSAATPERALMSLTWPAVLGPLVAGSDLDAAQTAWAMGDTVGEATDAQIAGFAVALRAKGETTDEVSGLVAAMYSRATPLRSSGACSTSSAPVATARCRSTSPRWPRSWPPAPAPGW